ncbi:MAG: hypothetical protein LBL04_08960 [Bacteroidales bacterium]|jgi:hypothetical protein|nr:hypothetical protein [Bacteroidales bacterium]
MATPVRMAPVLTTEEEIEYFHKTWAESLKRPYKGPSKEKMEEISAYVSKYLDKKKDGSV